MSGGRRRIGGQCRDPGGPNGRTPTEYTPCSRRGCCPAPRCPGELLTRGDVCHVHADRAEAEPCGVLLGNAPELVRLDEVRPAVSRRGVVAVQRRQRPAASSGLEGPQPAVGTGLGTGRQCAAGGHGTMGEL